MRKAFLAFTSWKTIARMTQLTAIFTQLFSQPCTLSPTAGLRSVYLGFAPSATPINCQYFKWWPSRSSMTILPHLIILSIFLFPFERRNSKILEIRIIKGHYSLCSRVHTLSWAEMFEATIWHSVYINIIKVICHISWFHSCFVLHSRLMLAWKINN